ncbi:hypothetical protein [Pedobacter steynii]
MAYFLLFFASVNQNGTNMNINENTRLIDLKVSDLLTILKETNPHHESKVHASPSPGEDEIGGYDIAEKGDRIRQANTLSTQIGRQNSIYRIAKRRCPIFKKCNFGMAFIP